MSGCSSIRVAHSHVCTGKLGKCLPLAHCKFPPVLHLPHLSSFLLQPHVKAVPGTLSCRAAWTTRVTCNRSTGTGSLTAQSDKHHVRLRNMDCKLLTNGACDKVEHWLETTMDDMEPAREYERRSDTGTSIAVAMAAPSQVCSRCPTSFITATNIILLFHLSSSSSLTSSTTPQIKCHIT